MKIVITGRNFTSVGERAMQMLVDAGHDVVDYSPMNMGSATDEEVVFEAVKDADIAITGLEPYTKTLIDRCPRLRMISRRGIGYDTVDVEACKKSGVTLARTVGMVEGSVAEHVMAYILYYSRRLDLQNQFMHEGRWERILMPGAKSRTLGLIGFGGIGKEIARRARPFGMKIVYYNRHPKKEWESEYGVTYMELDDLLAICDYVSVNVPLNDGTEGMFDATMFRKMKEGSCFINIARSRIMDAYALKKALDTGHLAGAFVDVYDAEPCTDSPLISCQNATLTPHTAPYTEENFASLNEAAAKNVLDYLAGRLPEKNRVV